jgi:catechol 2,3-dioxygenase-like lactoylglutathione lyase family enzyme
MKVSHTCLRVADTERALNFYGWFGFGERGRVGEGERQSVFCGLPGDEDRLQLSPASLCEPPAPGFGHLALEVDDLDEVLAMLRRHGVGPDHAPVSVPGLRLCYVHDPDGYAVELIERT